MIQFERTDSTNAHFIELVAQLDADLAERDGTDHIFYDQFNKVDDLKHVILVLENNKFIGCGAIKQYSPGVMEIKRMYTLPEHRGKGIASIALDELEKWAKELKQEKCILETGEKQIEALKLYKKQGYRVIKNYGPYTNIENSICFEKSL